MRITPGQSPGHYVIKEPRDRVGSAGEMIRALEAVRKLVGERPASRASHVRIVDIA